MLDFTLNYISIENKALLLHKEIETLKYNMLDIIAFQKS